MDHGEKNEREVRDAEEKQNNELEGVIAVVYVGLQANHLSLAGNAVGHVPSTSCGGMNIYTWKENELEHLKRGSIDSSIPPLAPLIGVFLSLPSLWILRWLYNIEGRK
jgi:hypothetical protein